MKWLQTLTGTPAGEADVGRAEAPLEAALVAEVAVALPTSHLAAEPVDVGAQFQSPESSPAVSGIAGSPPAPVPMVAPGIDVSVLMPKVEEVVTRQQDLLRMFESRLRSDDVQAKALERLHDELRQYKTNFIRQEMAPLFKDVIFCHDFVTKELARLKQAQPDAGVAALPACRSFEMLGQMLLDLLFKYDIEPFRMEGEQFDAKRQQCAQTIPTDDAARDKVIADQGVVGFQSPDGIIRREQVSVYKYKAPAAASVAPVPATE